MNFPQEPRSSADEKHSTGIVVLAAGASARMKQPKQLLRFRGKTLLRRAAETALASVFEPVVVVLGANFERAAAEIGNLPLEIVFNENWESGLSSSIRTGVERLLALAPDIAGCLLTLADQPLITAQHLNLFAERRAGTNCPIVVARYRQTRGVPALFSREVFDDLRKLSGDRGAKPLIEKHRASLATIDLPEAASDIDTPQDFADLSR